MTGAQALVRMLQAYKVEKIFGLCGDTSLPLYDAMFQLGTDIEHILCRDERHAAYMADAYARITGKPGICEGPSGGGATYILPGLVEANESSIALLAITTDISTTSRGRFPLTELDQVNLFRPITKWNTTLDDATRLPANLRTAFREMTTGTPGAVHLALPFDTQKQPVDESEIWADPRHESFPANQNAANNEAIKEAVEVLVKAKSTVAICGGGVVIAKAYEALEQLGELIELPIATSISGQGSIAETHSLAIGVVGTNGGVNSTREIIDEADTIIFIGCRAGSVTTERWFSPTPDKTIIHIDSDPNVIGANYQTEVGIVADARLALSALVSELQKRTDLSGQNGKLRAKRAWTKKIEKFNSLATSKDVPIKPECLIAALMSILDPDAIICADPGTPCPYISAYYRFQKPGRRFITNRAHGALGYSLAAAIGAHHGDPSVKTVAVMGDGSFGFCCGEFETITRHNLPITTIVISNSTYGWIKAGQNAGFNQRFYNVDFSQTDHAAVGAAFGLKTWRVENPSELKTVLKQAINFDGPTLVDVISQPLHEAEAPVSEWIA